MTRLGHFFFRYRDGLFPIVFLGLAVLSGPRSLVDDRALDHLAAGLGALIALAGQALRLLVIGLAYIVRGGKNRSIYADDLVQAGIFAHCRNPLYVGNALILCGVLVALHGSWGYAIGLPFIALVYGSIVRAEERYLARRFGDAYRAYCARVPRFGFRLVGLGETLRASRFDWRRAIRKEYGTPFAWISTIMGIVVWKDLSRGGLEAGAVLLARLGPLWALCVVAYMTARVLKKSGRLGSG